MKDFFYMQYRMNDIYSYYTYTRMGTNIKPHRGLRVSFDMNDLGYLLDLKT